MGIAAGVAAGWAAARFMAPALDLAGRTVLVTGGSRGLGLAIAQEVARHGANVVVCARDAAELDGAAVLLRAQGARVETIVCDVSDPQQVAAMVERAVDSFGSIDVLVNNAGIIQVGPLDAIDAGNFRDAMDAILWGTIHTSLAVLPVMRQNGGGRIVNVTSIGGKLSVPHLMPYSTAKFAAVGFSEGLRAEAAADNVRVTTVVPGLMRTGSDVQAKFAGRTGREYAWFAIAAAAPGLSMDARSAARRIVDAMRHGRAEVVLGLPAKLAVLAHGIAPGLTQRAMALANRLLPAADGASPQGETVQGLQAARGTPSLVTTLTRSNRSAGHNLNQPAP
jgi:NAD(P)-dependent dehydrogenase (short-subunit alcohol dehydrogenase family)